MESPRSRESPAIGEPSQGILSTLFFFVGSFLCLSFLKSPASWAAVFVAAVLVTGLRLFGRSQPATSEGSWRARLSRAARWLASLMLLGFHALVLYFCVVFGVLLGWSTPLFVRVLAMLALFAWGATCRGEPSRLRVPLAVPLGIWLSACLFGWQHEESFIRCDDLLRLRPPASLLLATTDVAECRPGQVLPIGRYPRKMWESPDGRRILFTTQAGNSPSHPAGRLNGLVCEAPVDGSTTPRCVGEDYGKSHGIFDAVSLGKILVTAWGLKGADGRQRSAVLTIPREGPLVLEDEHYSDLFIGELFYEPRSHTLYTFSDKMDYIRSFRYPSFEPLTVTRSAISPSEIRYDGEHDEGVICGALIGVSIHGNPLAWRSFFDVNPFSKTLLPLSWGCDWDQRARIVYSAIPNLGLMYVINYDSGRIERRHWIGLGFRTVAFDARRRLVYFGNFLRGDVIAVDADSGATRHRWFAGRFVREVRLSRDGNSLLVSANLGIVRIALDPS